MVAGYSVSTTEIPVAGMLDRDILTQMMLAAGVRLSEIRSVLPAVMEKAQLLYGRRCPDLRRKVCPGVRPLLRSLIRSEAVTGLVTGNLSRIGWKKMDRAGLKPYFRYGVFAEMARTRGELARMARRHAIHQGWVGRKTPVFLVGDHPNDIVAAQFAGAVSVAVATGVIPRNELAAHKPDILLDDLRDFRLDWIFR